MPLPLASAIVAVLLQSTGAPPPPVVDVATAPTAQSDAASGFPVALPGTRTLGPIDEARFDACHDAAVADDVDGIQQANRWLVEGGSYLALQCLGFAHSLRGKYAAAETAFVTAAREAEVARDWRSANLWAQAGNAALADGDPASAREHIDAALAQGHLEGLALGEAYLDRARAALAQEDWASARADLDLASQHAAQDPLVWLLSATLARRQNDPVRAQADIIVAASLGPRDAAIALEAGNIAAAGNRLDAAKLSWESAVALGGTTPPAATALGRLAELAAYQAEVDAAAPPAPAEGQAPQ